MSSVKTILYKQKTLKNGTHPVMLYIYEEKPYRLSLGYNAFPHEFDNLKGRFRKTHPNAKAKNLNIRKHELRASEIIEEFVKIPSKLRKEKLPTLLTCDISCEPNQKIFEHKFFSDNFVLLYICLYSRALCWEILGFIPALMLGSAKIATVAYSILFYLYSRPTKKKKSS